LQLIRTTNYNYIVQAEIDNRSNPCHCKPGSSCVVCNEQ